MPISLLVIVINNTQMWNTSYIQFVNGLLSNMVLMIKYTYFD